MSSHRFPLMKLATKDTPFYFYDLRLLRETLETINDEAAKYDDLFVHYAVKANANPRILELIANAGLGADCVSGGEVEAALKSGFPADGIVLAGVGKTDREIRLALRANIECFNAESIPELHVINHIAEQEQVLAKVALRINPNVDAHTNEKITTGLSENKFGIDASLILDAIHALKSLPYLRFAGLHFHIGSQITDMQPYVALCKRINELQDLLNKEGIEVPSINVGGGLGIDYENPDENPIPNFGLLFSTICKNLKRTVGQPLHFELGRSVVGQCGTLISSVLYVKEGLQKKFLIVDAGFTDLVRPAMYGAYHLIENLTAAGDRDEVYDIVGPICESTDTFATARTIKAAQRGDLIAFRSAGAYGESMASQYNCRKLPQAYFFD